MKKPKTDTLEAKYKKWSKRNSRKMKLFFIDYCRRKGVSLDDSMKAAANQFPMSFAEASYIMWLTLDGKNL